MEYKTGTLVEFRSRPWIVQQSSASDMLLLKPLGGSDAEIVGLYTPLYDGLADLKSYDFRKPTAEDVGKNSFPGASRLLYDACRLSFRDIAGQFQSLGRLSFDPRPYQMVPLILALKQSTVRLLISDDVGIGKTLESLIIAKELLDRKEISRFAVLCLPHLCEQWQNEIRDKFGLEAQIIRSSTISRLEKNLRANQNIFRDIPYQIISIDYIKSSERKAMFLQHCPEFVIVDEVHTCAKPKGANKSQQLRYSLLKDLSMTDRHLVLLTATPHSGNMEEFQSVIGLLKPEFESYTLDDANQRKKLSAYFIQRRRADVKPYVGDDVIFPTRFRIDDPYNISPKYHDLLMDIIKYVKSGVVQAKKEGKSKQRYIYWDLLALVRGVMSSPKAGISMLQNKIDKRFNESDDVTDDFTADAAQRIYTFNDSLKDSLNAEDVLPDSYEEASKSEKNALRKFITDLQAIIDNDQDSKVKRAFELAEVMLSEQKNPIVFCQYIQTAEYVKLYFDLQIKKNKKYKDVTIELVTSRLADEERKIKIDQLVKSPRHILICTDCLSEGVNLQNGFEAVVHYDLPWNPNRMEQRNGRIDRFGQTSENVIISTVFDDKNNPVDKIVMRVLYRKQDQIRKDLGIYIPIADNDSSIMETIMEQLIVLDTDDKYIHPSLFSAEDLKPTVEEHERMIERAVEMEKKSHTYFAHNTAALDPTRLIDSLNEAKKVIGDTHDTANFVISQLTYAGVDVKQDRLPLCYFFNFSDLNKTLKPYFAKAVDSKGSVKISFASPTPKGYMYIGRNHVFVEDLSRKVVNDSVNGGDLAAGRAMVVETNAVDKVTTVMLMRVRSVIRDTKNTSRELVGEEMIFVGYRGKIDNHEFLSEDECRELFFGAKASGNTDMVSQQQLFKNRISWIYDTDSLKLHTDEIALQRANRLVQAFVQYRSYVTSTEYQVVEPVLPMDIIAAYIYIPKR